MEITNEQIEKLEEGCGNSFKFDIPRYLYDREKRLVKDINIDDKHSLTAQIKYVENKNLQIPVLVVSLWVRTEHKMLWSDGENKYVPLGEPQKRKDFKLLKEYSKKITDDYIFEIHEGKISSSPLPVF